MVSLKKTSANSDPFDTQFESEGVDIKRYIALIMSNWYWFAFALFISMSISYGINRWSEEVYTVSSTLLIKDDQNSSLSNIFPGRGIYRSTENLTNEIGILKSYKVNYKTMLELPDFYVDYISVGKRGIAETRQYKSCPFIVVYDSLNKQSLSEKVEIKILSGKRYRLLIDGSRNFSEEKSFGDNFKGQGFNFTIRLRDSAGFHYNPNASNRYYFYFISPVTLANRYRFKLAVNPIEENASLVTLATTGFVPQQEVDYLNKLMQVYLNSGLEFKNQTAAQTIKFIENQLGVISDSLHRAEAKLEGFKLSKGIIDMSSQGSLLQAKLEKSDAAKGSLILQRKYYEYLNNYIESKSDTADIVAPSIMGVTDPLMINLVNQLSDLKKQKKSYSMNLNNKLEPVKLLDANIKTTSLSIAENISDGLRNIKSSIADADSNLKDIYNDIRKLPSVERQMINYQREYDINNTVYTFLLEKRAEAGISQAANVPDNRIIDNASLFTSSRIKPKTKQNLIIGLILGLFFPFIGIILIDLLNNKIIDKRDIEKGTNAPVIGYISHNSLDTEMPVIEKPGSTLAESFRSVRTNLRYFIKDTKSPVISVSSTITAEGKTFISANLAGIIALSGKKVLLVGLDLRKPRIHKIFGINNDTGISNFLIGLEKFEDVIKKTNVENLWYATSGPVPPNPAELIESAEMGKFIEKAKKIFDYIIIDTPPVAIVTDALLCSPFTDFYLFVVRQRYSSKNTLGLIEELHNNENLKKIAIVINDISISGYYGYGLRYGYSMGYGYSYGYNYYGNYSDRRYGYSDSTKSYYREE